MDKVNQYIDANRERFIRELLPFLQQPSISTQSIGIQECTRMLRGMMEALGIKVKIFPPPGTPSSTASWPGKRTKPCWYMDITMSNRRNHWTSGSRNPLTRSSGTAGFTPGQRRQQGTAFAHLAAIQALQAVEGGVPIN